MKGTWLGCRTMKSNSKNSIPDLKVCIGPRCGDYGGKALLDELAQAGIAAQATECHSLCPHAPIVSLPQYCLHRATLDKVRLELATLDAHSQA